MARVRPHCFNASKAMRLIRSLAFAAAFSSGTLTHRLLIKGRRALTPSSTAFCATISILSDFI